MLHPFSSFCVFFAEMLIAYTYFMGLMEQRFTSAKCVLFGTLLFSAGSAVNLLSGNNTTMNLFTSFFITTMFAIICFRGGIILKIFYTLIISIVSGTLEAVTLSLSAFVTGNAFLDYNNDPLLFLFEAISSKGLYYLVVLILVRIINPSGHTSRVPLIFFTYPVTSTFCLIIFWRICAQPECSSEVQFLISIAAVCLFVSSIMLFVTYSRQVEKDIENMEVRSELSRLQTEQSYYQILDQQNQQLMIYAHDAKKHLSAIQSLNNNPQINDYLSKLSQQLMDYTRSSHSGNKLLDVMLHKYAMDCELRGIQFEYDVKVCNLLQLDDIDLVAVLGNLMDNAITSAEQSEGKWVVLNTVRRNTYSVIVICNSCETPPRQSGKKLLSTKPDTKFHGFGLKSVARTIRKYQGDYDWEYNAEKKTFTVTVMISEKPNIPTASTDITMKWTKV